MDHPTINHSKMQTKTASLLFLVILLLSFLSARWVWIEEVDEPASVQGRGPKMSDSVMNAFQDLKLRHMHSYIIFGIDDEFEYKITKKSSPTAGVNELLADLKDDECAYVALNTEKNGVVFIAWFPSDAGFGQKKMYMIPMKEFMQYLGLGGEVVVGDKSQLVEELKRV